MIGNIRELARAQQLKEEKEEAEAKAKVVSKFRVFGMK